MEENRQNSYGSSKIEFTAKITGPDGQVVEKTVSTMGDIPSLEDFDLSTMEGFLSDFDTLEKAILEARNKIGKEMAAEYLEQVSKKNGLKHSLQELCLQSQNLEDSDSDSVGILP